MSAAPAALNTITTSTTLSWATLRRLLLLSILCSSTTVHASIWTPHIDEGPAPSPEDGPPFSAHASRNRALIPAQVGAIVGAYTFTLLVIGTVLLLVGRRLRRAAESSARTLDMEMVKPGHHGNNTNSLFRSPESQNSHHIWPSPDSFASTHIWPSPQKAFGWGKKPPLQEDQQKLTTPTPSTAVNPTPSTMVNPTPTSFDSRVIQGDMEQRAADLERLYAAVMREDTPRPTAASSEPSNKSPTGSPGERPKLATINTAITRIADGDKLRSPVQPEPYSPLKSSKASTAAAAALALGGDTHSRNASATSIPSVRSGRSGSRLSKMRSVRNLEISSPLPASHQLSPGQDAFDLPQRHYDPPGPPPPIPGSANSSVPRLAPAPVSTASLRKPSADRLDLRAQQQQQSPPLSPGATNFSRPGSRQQAQPSYPSLFQPFPTPGPAPTDRSLPLRAHAPSSTDPPSFKTTVLEPRGPAGPPGSGFDIRSPSGGPRTGVPATPYSPYMPFTPMTPVTPRLVTRQDRRRREREEGRRVAIRERDEVLEERELWDSGY